MSRLKKSPTIFAFSANSDLTDSKVRKLQGHNEKMVGLNIYHNYLRSAFKNKRIYNIFITGDFGIGKSSLIRSFDKSYSYKVRPYRFRKEKFLYLSLGKYEAQKENGKISLDAPQNAVTSPQESVNDSTMQNENQTPQRMVNPPSQESVNNSTTQNESQTVTSSPKESDDNTSEDKNADALENVLERRLLMQIYAYFHQKDLPASSFRMIRENRTIKWFIAVYLALLGILFFLKAFYDEIGEQIKNICIYIYGNELEQALTNKEEILKNYQENIDTWLSYGQLALYVVLAILIIAGVFDLIIYLLPKIQASSLNIKTETFEAECEMDACDDYLDHHLAEAVYCLETISRKVNYTVVIEDLDRVETSSCLEIFTRLREINSLVNIRLSQKGKKVRFVYIVNDKIIGKIQYSKFADYILPVMSSLNEMTVKQIISKNIKKINNELNKELNVHIDIRNLDELIDIIAPYLIDYRMQFAVINEYSQFFRLYHETNRETSSSSRSDDEIAKSILAISFYKNLFVDDYANIRSGKSRVFPYSPDSITNEEAKKLINALHDNKYLNIETLCYIGYSEQMVADFIITNKFNNSALNNTLENIDISNNVFNLALNRFSEDLIKKLCIPENEQNQPSFDEILEKAKIMVIHNKMDFNKQLFNGKITVLTILKILDKLNDNETLNVNEINNFFQSVGLDVEGNWSVFEKCIDPNASARGLDIKKLFEEIELSERQYEIACWGVGKNFNEDFNVNVKGRTGHIDCKPIRRPRQNP